MLNSISLFLFINFISIIIIISSNNIFTLWMGLEINMISFIPILFNKKNKRQSESMLKYFFIQTFASMIILLLINFQWHTNYFIMKMLILVSMSLKMALFPFVYWLIEVMEGLNWNQIMILSTWQKISPLYLTNLFFDNFMIFVSFMSIVMGTLLGVNQILVRKIIACSSISHSGWTCLTMGMNNLNWLIYFLIYSLINMNLIILFNFLNTFHLFNFIKSQKEENLIFLSLFSLAGLPPLTGFMNKFIIILIMNDVSILINFIIIFISLISLLFYMRLKFYLVFINKMNFKINFKNNMMKVIFIFTLFSNFFLFWFF